MENCIFCKIASGEIPAYQVWEDENFLAFLDLHPIKPGHTLVIPKKHLPYIFDIDDKELGDLMLAAKKVAETLKQTFNPKTGKIGVMVYGLDVDHTHVHLVPLDKGGDLSFTNAKDASKEELEATLVKIRSK